MKTDQRVYRLHSKPEMGPDPAGALAPFTEGLTGYLWGHALLRLIVAPEQRVPVLANDLLIAAGDEGSTITREPAIDLLETVLVYKLPEISLEEIGIMLHLPDTDLKQTRFYREVFAEGEAHGEARGKALGEVKGRHEGEVLLVLRLLHRRLGSLSEDCDNAVGDLSLDQLETLAEDLWGFHAEDDLLAWLASQR